MLPKSSVTCKALPLCTQTQMFSEDFSTRPFLLAANRGGEKLPEKPCDISEMQFPRNSVNILTFTAPGFPHPSTHSGLTGIQALVSPGSATLSPSLCHSYSAGSELSCWVIPRHNKPMGVFTPILHPAIPTSSTSRDTSHPRVHSKPQMAHGGLVCSSWCPVSTQRVQPTASL